jgi:hypothetical protein
VYVKTYTLKFDNKYLAAIEKYNKTPIIDLSAENKASD